MLSYRKLAMRVLGRPLHTGGGNDSPRPASQRAAALVLTAAMLTTLTAPAFAETWDIEKGDITVKAGDTEGTNKVSQGTIIDKEDTNTVITGKSDKNTVTIEAKDKDDKVEVTLKDLNIDASSGSEAAVSVTGEGNTNIELDGDNALKSDIYSSGISSSGSLTISGGENDSLTAQGGSGADGIYSSGSLTISGGTVTANGGDGGDGIWSSGGVTISGGSTVTANGGDGKDDYGGDGIRSDSGDVTISGGSTVTANGGNGGNVSGDGIRSDSGDVTISGGTVKAAGGDSKDGYGGDGIRSGGVTISGGTVNAAGGNGGKVGGYGICSFARVAISGGTVNAAGIGGGYGAENDDDGNGNQITIKSNESGAPTVNATGGESSIDEETAKKTPGGAGIGSGASKANANITLEGKVTIVAKAGEGNAAIGDMNGEQVFTGLDGSITRYDSEGNDTTLPTDPVPAVPSASGGGSADASVQESVFPGLVVTDKDGQRISYTSIRGNNVLSLRVGRFTASLRVSLAALRQLRAEGIDTITFQTILCSTTLSVDELLAMGGEDAEAVLTHRLTASSLTVG